jgi:hypothetical protein
MERPGFQMSVAALLGVVACIALNIWLFRFGPLLGIIGLNISKHVLIAYLCKVLGVDRRKPNQDASAVPSLPAQLTVQ